MENVMTSFDYERVFSKFRARTNELQNTLDWVKENSDRLKLPSFETVLSVGSGSGSFDLVFAKMLPKLERFVVVEPNTKHINQFREAAKGLTGFEFYQQHFEESTVKSNFDLALMSHCLYYLPDRLASLRLLSEKADYFILLHQTELGIHDLQQRFGGAKTKNFMFSSLQVADLLNQLELPYEKFRVDSYIDVAAPDPDLIFFFLEEYCTEARLKEISSHLHQKYPDNKMYEPIDIFLVKCS